MTLDNALTYCEQDSRVTFYSYFIRPMFDVVAQSLQYIVIDDSSNP
jgi:hypothetical protein